MAGDIGVVEEIVAKVNGDVITRGDMDRALRSVAAELQQQGVTGLRLEEALKELEPLCSQPIPADIAGQIELFRKIWITSALGLELPIAAVMTGGVFSELDGREVPDTFNVTLEYPGMIVVWQSVFSNSHSGLGNRILGSDGTIESLNFGPASFFPEKANDPGVPAMQGENKGVNHMANWFDCIRSRNQATNAPIETGFRTAIAGHLANLAYRRKQRVTLEEGMAAPASAWM